MQGRTLVTPTEESIKLPLIGSTHSKTSPGGSSEIILSKQQSVNPHDYFCVLRIRKLFNSFSLYDTIPKQRNDLFNGERKNSAATRALIFVHFRPVCKITT